MYRDFARRAGKAIGLVGTVKNELNGSVTVIAEGEEEKIRTFLGALHKGPLLARVDSVDVAWNDAQGEMSDFKILYY